MNKAAVAVVALTTSMLVSSAFAAAVSQPPMGNFNNAFYTCDDNAAFLMSYEGKRPNSASMTTSNNSKKYMLKKVKVDSGVQFSGEAVKFWTDGTTVTVEGTEIPLKNCKVKAG